MARRISWLGSCVALPGAIDASLEAFPSASPASSNGSLHIINQSSSRFLLEVMAPPAVWRRATQAAASEEDVPQRGPPFADEVRIAHVGAVDQDRHRREEGAEKGLPPRV